MMLPIHIDPYYPVSSPDVEDREQRGENPLSDKTKIYYHQGGFTVNPIQIIDPDEPNCLIIDDQENHTFNRKDMVTAILQTFGLQVPPTGCGNEQNRGMIAPDELVRIIRSTLGFENGETIQNGRDLVFLMDNHSYYLNIEPSNEIPAFTAIFSVIHPDQDKFIDGNPVVVETTYPNGVAPSNIYKVFIPLTDPYTGDKVIGLVVIYFDNKKSYRNSPFSVFAFIHTPNDNVPQQIEFRDIIALDKNCEAYGYITLIDWPPIRRIEVKNIQQKSEKIVTNTSNRNLGEVNNNHNRNRHKGLPPQERHNGRKKQLIATKPTRRRDENRPKIPQRRK